MPISLYAAALPTLVTELFVDLCCPTAVRRLVQPAEVAQDLVEHEARVSEGSLVATLLGLVDGELHHRHRPCVTPLAEPARNRRGSQLGPQTTDRGAVGQPLELTKSTLEPSLSLRVPTLVVTHPADLPAQSSPGG